MTTIGDDRDDDGENDVVTTHCHNCHARRVWLLLIVLVIMTVVMVVTVMMMVLVVLVIEGGGGGDYSLRQLPCQSGWRWWWVEDNDEVKMMMTIMTMTIMVSTTHHDNSHARPTEPLKLLLEENYREQAHEDHDGTFYQEDGEKKGHKLLTIIQWKYFLKVTSEHLKKKFTSEHLELGSRSHGQSNVHHACCLNQEHLKLNAAVHADIFWSLWSMKTTYLREKKENSWNTHSDIAKSRREKKKNTWTSKSCCLWNTLLVLKSMFLYINLLKVLMLIVSFWVWETFASLFVTVLQLQCSHYQWQKENVVCTTQNIFL